MSIGPKQWSCFLLLFGAQLAAQKPNWTQQSPHSSPAGRGTALLAYDSKLSQVVLFAGATANTAVANDTWTWDGTNWIQLHTAQSPPPRSNSAMIDDSQHGQMVMYGGWVAANSTYLNDTWIFDGSNWTQFQQNSPPARGFHAMAYDAKHGQVIVFGGKDVNGNPSNDTWLFDGTNWTLAHSQFSPAPRFGLAMAYDAAHGQVVLFGGANNSTNFGDTWTWDGTNWKQSTPQNSPPAQSFHEMVYDSVHDQVVLFGGGASNTDQTGVFNDTWLWDGSNWTQAAPANSPTARNRFGMAFDSAHAQAVLFGGRDAANDFLGDTWTWSGGAVTPPPPTPTISSVESASGYGGFSAVAPGSWVEIYGSNLAPVTRQWAGSDFNNGNAPTSLGGVQVMVGGQNAFVEYIATNPGQINVQLPSNIPAGGPLPITVMNGTATSNAVNVTVHTVEPGLLAPSSFVIGGKQYVVAVLPDGATYILPQGAISGVASRPAKPGDTITLYGIGFGAVTPAIPAGQIVTQQNQLVQPLQIMFGQTPAQVTYDGLVPNFVGLYQINVVVPQVPDNLLTPLTFNLGGIAGTQTLYIAVQQGS
ncbi:MAG TPA: kelch repeat-containing protein [Bryobacteraceae bacterium]|nr:kelch repeat-containing protein [Bryobacteraceae bacterium]